MLAVALGAIATTILLLGIGMVIGFYIRPPAATTVTFAAGPPTRPDRGLPRSECLESAEVLRACIGIALESASRHRETAPLDLIRAVDQLIAVTQKLSAQLPQPHDVQAQPTARIAKSEPERLVTQEQDSRIARIASADNLKPGASLDPSILSMAEMQELTSSSGNFRVDDSPKRRYPYNAYQLVIPVESSSSLPCFEENARVRCHDVSVHGISFFWPDEPDFERLVISLGTTERPIWMSAEVMQSKAVFMHDEVQTLIGCRFTGRFSSPEDARRFDTPGMEDLHKTVEPVLA